MRLAPGGGPTLWLRAQLGPDFPQALLPELQPFVQSLLCRAPEIASPGCGISQPPFLRKVKNPVRMRVHCLLFLLLLSQSNGIQRQIYNQHHTNVLLEETLKLA